MSVCQSDCTDAGITTSVRGREEVSERTGILTALRRYRREGADEAVVVPRCS